MPQVSIIIPAYNAERTILETINSVLQQTMTDFELIVIDDGSQDQTIELIQGLSDKRIRLLAYENGGLATARNRGIMNAQGAYLSFLDCDDLWTVNKLEKQLLSFKESPQAGVSYSWTTYMHEEDGTIRYSPAVDVHHEGDVLPQLLLRNFIESGSNILVKKEAIDSVGLFDAAAKNCEDWDYYLRLATKWEFALVPEHQILYRKSAETMSSQIDATEKGVLTMLEKVYKTVPPSLQTYKKRSLSNHYRHCAGRYLTSSQDRSTTLKALSLMRLSIQTWPQTLLQTRTSFTLFRLLLNFVLSPSLIHRLHDMKIKYVNRTMHDPRTTH